MIKWGSEGLRYCSISRSWQRANLVWSDSWNGRNRSYHIQRVHSIRSSGESRGICSSYFVSISLMASWRNDGHLGLEKFALNEVLLTFPITVLDHFPSDCLWSAFLGFSLVIPALPPSDGSIDQSGWAPFPIVLLPVNVHCFQFHDRETAKFLENTQDCCRSSGIYQWQGIPSSSPDVSTQIHIRTVRMIAPGNVWRVRQQNWFDLCHGTINRFAKPSLRSQPWWSHCDRTNGVLQCDEPRVSWFTAFTDWELFCSMSSAEFAPMRLTRDIHRTTVSMELRYSFPFSRNHRLARLVASSKMSMKAHPPLERDSFELFHE
jgi:hypothetical protein